jgi:methionyl-tRNA formyltransferase
MPGAVKEAALGLGVPILQPDRLRSGEFTEQFAALGADIGVVAAYGRILPQALIDAPRLGLINVHASLLPRWRGAAPIHRAILAGDQETGITIMRVVLTLDAGPMILRTRLAIGPDERSTELEARLAEAGAAVAIEALDAIEAGTAVEEPQDETRVTYAERLVREDSQVDWNRSAQAIHDQIRGLHPWPLAAAMVNGVRLRLVASRIVDRTERTDEPGRVAAVTRDELVVATGAGAVALTSVQPEGRPAMSIRDYLNGRAVAPGDRLDPIAFGP